MVRRNGNWGAFLMRTETDAPESLAEVTGLLKDFLSPVLTPETSRRAPARENWLPGGPWT